MYRFVVGFALGLHVLKHASHLPNCRSPATTDISKTVGGLINSNKVFASSETGIADRKTLEHSWAYFLTLQVLDKFEVVTMTEIGCQNFASANEDGAFGLLQGALNGVGVEMLQFRTHISATVLRPLLDANAAELSALYSSTTADALLQALPNETRALIKMAQAVPGGLGEFRERLNSEGLAAAFRACAFYAFGPIFSDKIAKGNMKSGKWIIDAGNKNANNLAWMYRCASTVAMVEKKGALIFFSFTCSYIYWLSWTSFQFDEGAHGVHVDTACRMQKKKKKSNQRNCRERESGSCLVLPSPLDFLDTVAPRCFNFESSR